MTELTPQMRRTLFHISLVLCFGLGVYFNQYDVFYPKPFLLVAFAGTIGILVDYASRIRKQSLFWLVPALLATELTATLVSKSGYSQIAWYLYLPASALFLVYGSLYVRSAFQNRDAEQGIFWKFLVLGLSSSAITAWEVVTYFPFTLDKSHLAWRILYLFVFAWLLLIDFSTRFDKLPQLKIERQILRISLAVIAIMYFDRFVFQ